MEGIDAILRDPKTGQRLYPKTYEWNIIDGKGNKLSSKLAGLVDENGRLKHNNLLSGELQLGKYDMQTGEYVSDDTFISNIEYLPISVGSQIFINFIDLYALNKNSENHYITFYDIDKNFVGVHRTLENITVPDNIAYFKFNIAHSKIVTLDDINELQVSSYGRHLYEKDLAKLVDDEELRAAIEAIPTPDVSGQISNHNLDTAAHPDIRELINTKIAELVSTAPETLDTLGEVAKALGENKDVVDTLNASVGNKLDKINAIGEATSKVYVASNDGTQTSAKISNAVTNDAVVQRGANGEILVRDTPEADNEAVSKKFVEDSISNNIPDVSSQIEEHNTSTTAHSDIRTEIETVRSEIPDVEDFLKYVEDNESGEEINPEYDYYKKTETYSAEEIDAKLAESGKIKSITVNGEATEIIDGNVDVVIPEDYDLVIKTQEEFEAFYTSLDNETNTFKHILLEGDGGTLKFTRDDGKGLTFNTDIESIHGKNGAIISILNFNDSSGDAVNSGYAIKYSDSSNEVNKSRIRSFKDINIEVTSEDSIGYLYVMYGLSNIYNVRCDAQGRGIKFFSYCYNLNNCLVEFIDEEASFLHAVLEGFSWCDSLNNCTCYLVGAMNVNGSAFNICDNLNNCYGAVYELGGNHPSIAVPSMSSFCICSNINNCTGECMTVNSRALAFDRCDLVINSMGGAGGVTTAIAFNECESIVNVQAIAADIMETGTVELITFNKCNGITGYTVLDGNNNMVECTNVSAMLEDLSNGTAGYDIVIDSQDMFDAFVQACNNQECTATSVLIKGFTDGDTVYHLKDSYILLPNTLKKIHGQDNPIIFAEYTKEQLDIMFIFAYLEELEDYSDYSIENLTVNVYGFYKPSELFLNLGNVRNIDIYSFGRPCDSFFRCKNIENVNIHHDISDAEHELFSIDINEFQHCDNINNINMLVDNGSDKEGVFYAFVDCKNIGFHTLSGYTSALRPEDHLGVNKNVLATQADLPTKTSQLENDGDGTGKYATEAYVATNGGKIDVIKVDGVEQSIIEKAVDIKMPDVSNFITKEVKDLTYYTPTSEIASSLTLVVNNSTYELTASLKDSNGNVISSSVADLPLETMVVSADYLSESKEIQLTLQNGNKTTFSVSDLVSGLATTSELNAVKSSLANYLPLAGGTLTGTVTMSAGDFLARYVGVAAAGHETGDYDKIAILSNTTNGYIRYRTKAEIKADLGVPTDYLPTTGGTVKNSGFGNQLTIERSDTGPTAIWFKTNGTSYGYIGITESKPAFWNSDHSAFEYLSLASHTHSQYAVSNHTHSTYITQSQMETYVQEQIAAAITAALEAEY